MSRSTRTSRQGSFVQDASTVIQSLVKQPVKSAVREALAEDRAAQNRETGGRGQEHDTGKRTKRSSKGSRAGGALRKTLVLGAIAGAIYYMTRKQGIDIQGELSEEVGVGDAGMESEGPTEDPLSSDTGRSEDTTDRGTDEGPTTRS